jgi:hypothetical protein
MAKSKKQDDQIEDEAVIMERMEQALKRGLNMPHKTNEELAQRRHKSDRHSTAHRKSK